ncbi:MAG: peptidoglycan editing factor PgeF [Gammaproteobacteria bacterium]|nr:peptidoglycan editing factor PgeF [Gammaproteobacteria bacterium]
MVPGPAQAGRDIPLWWWPARWPVPPHVRAGITTRDGGCSAPPFASFNLAAHVGDRPSSVHENRTALRQGLRLPSEPCWLQQAHGSRVVSAAGGCNQAADGSHASTTGQVCAVLVADCVPLLLSDASGTQVAAIHAGWRGIAAGIVAAGISTMRAPADQLLAWIGPCIGPERYEVGAEVRCACLETDPGAGDHFRRTTSGRWLADLPALVCCQLRARDVHAIYSADLCTHARPDLFFSHRRDGSTGRMAALIWLDPDRTSP